MGEDSSRPSRPAKKRQVSEEVLREGNKQTNYIDLRLASLLPHTGKRAL